MDDETQATSNIRLEMKFLVENLITSLFFFYLFYCFMCPCSSWLFTGELFELFMGVCEFGQDFAK